MILLEVIVPKRTDNKLLHFWLASWAIFVCGGRKKKKEKENKNEGRQPTRTSSFYAPMRMYVWTARSLYTMRNVMCGWWPSSSSVSESRTKKLHWAYNPRWNGDAATAVTIQRTTKREWLSVWVNNECYVQGSMFNVMSIRKPLFQGFIQFIFIAIPIIIHFTCIVFFKLIDWDKRQRNLLFLLSTEHAVVINHIQVTLEWKERRHAYIHIHTNCCYYHLSVKVVFIRSKSIVYEMAELIDKTTMLMEYVRAIKMTEEHE
jgi:hypothetical protein